LPDNISKPIHKNYKPELILLTVSVYWGLTFPLIKLVLNDVSPYLFVFSRFVFTLILFLIIFRVSYTKQDIREIKKGFILGIFLFVGFMTQTIGLKYTTASKSAFITGINIVLLPFVQMILIRKKPNLGNITGIIVVMLGLYFLTELKNSEINFGDIITLVCAVIFAFHIVLLDKYSQKAGHINLIYGQYLSMVVFSLFSMILFEVILQKDLKFNFNSQSVFIVIFTAVFSTFLALYLAMKYQKFVTPVRAGLIYNMEQVFAVISAYFILSEIMSTPQIIGAIIMTIGLIISEIFTKFTYAGES
jgi:drug/metabolite transporter (DMT)-like permease